MKFVTGSRGMMMRGMVSSPNAPMSFFFPTPLPASVPHAAENHLDCVGGRRQVDDAALHLPADRQLVNFFQPERTLRRARMVRKNRCRRILENLFPLRVVELQHKAARLA